MTILNNTSIFWRKSTTKRKENKEQRKADGDDYNDDDDNFTQWNTKKLTFTLKWHLSFDVRKILLYVHKFWSSFIKSLNFVHNISHNIMNILFFNKRENFIQNLLLNNYIDINTINNYSALQKAKFLHVSKIKPSINSFLFVFILFVCTTIFY